MKKVTQQQLSEAVYDELRRAIFTGELPLGQRLNIPDIAETLSVSPSPIMVAVRRLSQEGLVVIKPRVGSFVAEMSPPQLKMLMQVREMMELFAMQNFNPSPMTMDHLDHAVVRMNAVYSVNSPDAYWEFNEYDAQFHETLIGALGNPLMKDMYRQLHFHFWIGRIILAAEGQSSKWRASRGDHDRILDALQQGHIPLAAKILGQHLQATRLLIESYIHAINESQESPPKTEVRGQ
ncbi:MAG: GntR family transcriptional regulator [Firmicutes bacterium]|nr:GntR family transcriptional regulator [Bacillota bacterium]